MAMAEKTAIAGERALRTVALFREISDILRAQLNDLVLSAAKYDRYRRSYSAKLATNWAAQFSDDTAADRRDGEEEAGLAQDARDLMFAAYRFAQTIESGFAESLMLAPLTEIDLTDLLLGILGERALCSNLCKDIIPQWQMPGDEASVAARRAPSAIEIDAMLAHGTKLITLLDEGRKAYERRTQNSH